MVAVPGSQFLLFGIGYTQIISLNFNGTVTNLTDNIYIHHVIKKIKLPLGKPLPEKTTKLTLLFFQPKASPSATCSFCLSLHLRSATE